MLIQKELEAKIITALTTNLEAASVSGVTVKGAWQTSMTGLVKWISSAAADDPAFVSVSVGCPSWQTYTTPVVDFPVNITLFIRCELDPTGAKLEAVATVIEELLLTWQSATYPGTFTALDLTNLSVDGVNLQGANAPTINGANASVSWHFTLSGSYRESTN